MIVIIERKTVTIDSPFQTERARSTRVKFIAPSLRGEARRPIQAKDEFVLQLRSATAKWLQGLNTLKLCASSSPKASINSSRTKQTPQNTLYRTRTQGKEQFISWVT
jgi:hypothetical protein